MKILADKRPDVRCFNRFLSVKVLFSNIVKSTNYREICHLYCSLLILSLPPFLWVSPAEILSLCEVSRMTDHWDGPSYILHPSDSSTFNISILQSRQFSSAWWRTRLWRFISAFFVVLMVHKMITYFYLLLIPSLGQEDMLLLLP